jgi:hypothetical protein
LRGGVRTFAETDQRLGEGFVGMHGDVAGDVVKDVRFGEIVELIGVADVYGGGKSALAEAIEENERGDVAAHSLRLKSGERAQKPVYVFEARDSVGWEGQRRDALQEMNVRIFLPLRLHAGVEKAPGAMILRCIGRLYYKGWSHLCPPRLYITTSTWCLAVFEVHGKVFCL